MKAVTFTLELLEPLMATGLEGDPNSNVTLDYIPGSLIRGAIIARYLRGKPTGYQFDPASSNQDERKLFFDGAVRYLNAYPLLKISSDEKRTLPTSLSWFAVKDSNPTDENPTVIAHDLCCKSANDAFGSEQIKPLPSPFSYLDNADIYLIKPEHRLAIHTQRERRHGRSTQADGAVFRYDALETGSRFGAVILFEDDTLIGEIETLLRDKQLNLGGSRTAGYGRAKVCDWNETTTWHEANEPADIAAEDTITITLLSNALVRNDNGQYQTDLSLEELKKRLGDIREETGEKFNRTFKQIEIVGGFNRKWGLPLPQAISIKAGSVFTFKAHTPIKQNEIATLIEAGIGERRAEGFGRIAINLNTEDKLMWRRYELKHQVSEISIANNLSRGLAEQMLRKIQRQKLNKLLLEKVADYTGMILGKLPNHQISRLRSVIREASRSGDKGRVKRFFDENRHIANEHFNRVKINGMYLPKWTQDRLDEQKEFVFVPPALGKNDTENRAVTTEFTDELKLEYHFRLIDGVLAHMAKANSQGD